MSPPAPCALPGCPTPSWALLPEPSHTRLSPLWKPMDALLTHVAWGPWLGARVVSAVFISGQQDPASTEGPRPVPWAHVLLNRAAAWQKRSG